MSLLWRNIHCRERRKIEEYSSSEVTDSDNNSIKESIEFSEPSFRTNLVEVTSETELQNSHFLLEVTSESELQKSHFEMQRKELVFLFCIASVFCVFVCFEMREKERYL